MRPLLFLGPLCAVGCMQSPQPNRVTILHTNDWQSHMLGHGPNAEYTPDTVDDDETLGGMARVAAFVAEKRSTTLHPVLLFDGGDWMAGSLFQELGTTHASELQMMDALQYDAVTIGNHEFDWGPDTLAEIIAKGDELGGEVPIVASNLVPSGDAGDDALEALFDAGRIERTRTLTLDNGLTVGLFGLLGEGAAAVAPSLAPMTIDVPAHAAHAAVEELQAQGVDLVVGITHAGVEEDFTVSNEVEGIDVIVGGHDHTPLFDYETSYNRTVILQAGAYTRYVGQLDLVQDPLTGRWDVERYELHVMDDTRLGEEAISSRVDAFVEAIDTEVLSDRAWTFDDPIVKIPTDLNKEACAETALGNLVTDSYIEAANRFVEDPIRVSAEAQGVIRDPMLRGDSGHERFSDLFRVLPLTTGANEALGTPLVEFYVTPKELYDACEVTASIAEEAGCSFFVEFGGLRCHADLDERMLDRVTYLEILDENGEWVYLDTRDRDLLIHMVATTYLAGLMPSITEQTMGMLEIQPKDRDGNPIEDLSTRLIDTRPGVEGVQQLKTWEALTLTAQSFPDVNGDELADLPSTYTEPEGRLVGFGALAGGDRH